MVSSERATGHRLALKDLCRIGPRNLFTPLNLVASLYQIQASYFWLHHATSVKDRSNRLMPAPSRMKYESKLKLRGERHTNEKHEQTSGNLSTDDEKRAQKKFDALRRRSSGSAGGSAGQLCRRSKSSSSCRS